MIWHKTEKGKEWKKEYRKKWVNSLIGREWIKNYIKVKKLKDKKWAEKIFFDNLKVN